MRTARLLERLIASLKKENRQTEIARVVRIVDYEPLRTVRNSIVKFSANNDMLWASALTYTSSLALVPILALAFSALAGFGGEGRIRPLIERYLAANSAEITDALMNFVSNISAKALGEIGGAVLLVTVILTLGTVEQAFNSIFNVARGRSWLRKFSDYLSVIFTVPLLVVAAVPVRAHLLRALPHVPGAAWAVSTLMVWSGFTFLYLFFPNTRVRLGAAAMGGLIAAILLQAGQWAYVYFQIGVARYHAIYGAMAAVPILLTWIYLAWIIVLYGAELTVAIEGIEPIFTLDHRTPGFIRVAALTTVFRAGQQMLAQPSAPPCTLHRLAGELGVAEVTLQPIIEQLKRGGILIEAIDRGALADRSSGIFLARDSSKITLAEVLEALNLPAASAHGGQPVAALLKRLTATEHELLAGLTVTDLVDGRIAAPLAHAVPKNQEQ